MNKSLRNKRISNNLNSSLLTTPLNTSILEKFLDYDLVVHP
ncbi:hypothetical protein J5U23_01436 [Saccharolobus shibatae B12]|uniref:Uncharacterized protein n=1 Tax=Saccharolobus shibatae (strain ATCC 51178 / DSM 5389 / JCM 8931 / NBRC 15437 / B12) TaxID=523848 RepID=A0A8F5BNJ9_SACSH|nr:hypothetical protein J5U23_01436 [Saccharolobus shibatae B12]